MTGSNSPGSAPFVAQSAKTNESAGDLKWRCQWSFMHERDLLALQERSRLPHKAVQNLSNTFLPTLAAASSPSLIGAAAYFIDAETRSAKLA
ncbi:hypothetical protein ELH68_30760 (plasmid) [Rhizobium ruizarguesonis]|nr:hypothetical protein ELH68_30760 [Rhizobium ruizarguesonis]TCA35628.1 hypothetical protein E0H70_04615 [Rhizobium leguminosarum bv. viciae]TAZ91900.1 hypothetical protein ELH64_30250 [Rhizobium ruizarguesonis]TBA14109.1 hypothetical protein ELH61_27720 [Rhizobium ruizarguesonis]TBA54122.1 hypothetical protein ELH57_31505 [Rhizobium ruizarguesonis]